MKKNRLNILVSGLGRISWQFHLICLAKDPRFHLLAVADPLAERLNEAAAAYPGLHTYDSCRSMLESETEADLLIIASPTTFHCSQAIDSFMHGIDVFCEKPMSDSFADGMKMAESARNTGRKLMVYQPHRCRGEFLTFQRMVRGKLGRIFQSHRVYATFNRRNDWQSRTVCGGGMLNNYGAHYIDQFFAAFGAEKTEVRGASLLHSVGIGDADDIVNVLLRSPEGICGKVDINLGSAFFEDSWTVNGTLGSARYSVAEKSWLVHSLPPAGLSELPLQTGFAADGRRYSQEGEIPWRSESIPVEFQSPKIYYDMVFDFFALDAPPFVPVEESLELLRILDACRNFNAK